MLAILEVAEYFEVGLVHFVGEVQRRLVVIIVPFLGRGAFVGVGHSQEGVANDVGEVRYGSVLLLQSVGPLLGFEILELLLLDDGLDQLLAVVVGEFEHGEEVTGSVPILLFSLGQIGLHELLPSFDEGGERFVAAESIVAVDADHATVGIAHNGQTAHVVHLFSSDVAIAQQLGRGQMHDVAVLVGARAPIDGLAQSKERIVDEPEVPSMHGHDATDHGGRADDRREQRNEHGHSAHVN
mmetsp:Transcript_6609/g.14641  ORF Transcript_6609/g.14641 Transcript_6609/m.14641 type:complete len:240 (-) Transcript_6609:562-1281(-)